MPSRILALFLSGLVGLVVACATLQDASTPAKAFYDCTVRAFLPVAGTYERAEEIVRQVRAKQVDVPGVLYDAKATAAEAHALDLALRACVAQGKADLDALKADAGTSE